MKLKKITAREAKRITKKLGLCWGDDQSTYYATNDDESEVWEFDNKSKRDVAVYAATEDGMSVAEVKKMFRGCIIKGIEN